MDVIYKGQQPLIDSLLERALGIQYRQVELLTFSLATKKDRGLEVKVIFESPYI